MYSARGHISLKPRLHRLQDRTTIGVLAQAQYLEKHCLLEWTEDVCHNGYIVGIKQTLSTLLFASSPIRSASSQTPTWRRGNMEAAGVERERSAIVNPLMARDFWANAFVRW
jgi:hypothetical protein